MKIAFWSNVRGQCGTTLHLTSIAIVQALYDKKRVVMLENHDHLMNIESCLARKENPDTVKENIYGYSSYGLENLMQNIGKVSKEKEASLIRRCSQTYVHDRLYYLPHSYLKNRDVLDYHLENKLTDLLNKLEQYFDAVYIDTFAAESSSTESILKNTDVVVVNLNQNRDVLSHFFRNFSSLRNRSIFLLGNYYPCRQNSIYEIRRRYQIPEDRLYAIPFCMEAAEAESEGCLANFIGRNLMEPSVSNREFIYSIYNAYQGIMSYSSSTSSEKRGFNLM
ncbi:MAG: hypothetical protein E7267_00055 [Lachnospiraceae bacterium]|nr:hypothetical protein [Lachnospiraceae bacterium]